MAVYRILPILTSIQDLKNRQKEAISHYFSSTPAGTFVRKYMQVLQILWRKNREVAEIIGTGLSSILAIMDFMTSSSTFFVIGGGLFFCFVLSLLCNFISPAHSVDKESNVL